MKRHLRVPLRLRLRRNRGRLLRRLAAAFLVLIAALCTAAVVAYRLTGIPEPHPETVTQSTVFVDEKGSYLGRRGPVDRQEVPLSQVPRYVQDAVIAAENRSFRTDDGVSPRAIARAVLASLTGGERQGGSTITQQYVKNALLSPEQSLTRKAREALIAIKLDRTRSKDDILAGYLNTVYFGRGSAGIQAASRNYFGVDTHNLTVSQGAALASIVNIPSYYEKAGSDPKVTATLKARWEWVLDAMAASGGITAKQRAEAAFPAFRFYPPGTTEGQRQYMIDVAAKEAADRLGITEDQLARGGYTVHTTFDLALQDATTEAVKDLKGSKGSKGSQGGEGGKDGTGSKSSTLHTAVVAIKPGDGAVRLLYGGSDYARQPFNDAVGGAVEADTALDPFGKVRLGAPLTDLPKTAAPTPLQLASAYATVAANGVYATPYTVMKITRDGRTVYTTRPETRQALDEKEAYFVGEQVSRTYEEAGPSYKGTVLPDTVPPYTVPPYKEAVPSTSAAQQTPPAFFTAGAGGGITRRTVWSTGLDPQLALTVALFADRPGERKNTTVPAQLPNDPDPTGSAEETAGRIWGLATAGAG
ncbi:transglycosylase domain-containing protein [Streptomyces pseudovenezuelae]|uniref:Membrane peptidoglycan carboxypeptidase n=1 Tax=Streptomyces pseudovenezuelae TaxID=67350 RepID=A0ABT6LFV8_9ACTN|nr:transglycosylase domain-containing protein [Streptomyces pseudovenezuelae]MDH6214840.1 membrane peptidoglycan carboxypeptidase [Streptomyces pseudovenezuelae]